MVDRSSERRKKSKSSSRHTRERKLIPGTEEQENILARWVRKDKEGWGMFIFALFVFLYVVGFCSLSTGSHESDVALPSAETVRVSKTKSFVTGQEERREKATVHMLPGAIKSLGNTFESDVRMSPRRSANVMLGAIGLTGPFDGKPDDNGGMVKDALTSSELKSSEKGGVSASTTSSVSATTTLLRKNSNRTKGKPSPQTSNVDASGSDAMEKLVTSTDRPKLKRRDKRSKLKSSRRLKKTKMQRKGKRKEEAIPSGQISKVAGVQAEVKSKRHEEQASSEGTAESAFSGPHPMNRNMEDLQISEGAGLMNEAAVQEAYKKLVKAYLAPFSTGIVRRSFFEVLRRKTYSLTPPGANKGVQTILFQIVDGKLFLLDPYEVRKNSKPFYRSRIKELIWLLSEVAKGGKIPDTEFLLAIHDCVQTVNKDHTYRGSVYKESNPTFTIVSCNFSDNIPFPMWEGDEVRGGLKSWDEKMEQYQKADTTPWKSKKEQAVFRGGNRPSMYFKKKNDANEHCDDVGRSRLHHVAEQNPEFFNVGVSGVCGGKSYSLSRLTEVDHHNYKYIMYAEGNCFWADRLNKQVFGPSAIIKQETPCGQFWEPLLKPMTHYIPTDFFFQDTVDQVNWAKTNDDKVQAIVKNANDFASSFLSVKGIKTYVEVLLTEYTKLLENKAIKAEKGSEEVTV